MRLLRRLVSFSVSCLSSRFTVTSFSLALSFFIANASHSATIVHGDYSVPGTGITFQDVSESSTTDPVPMFNAPDPSILPLDFDPTSFTSFSANGGADVTIGQLNFTIKGLSNASGLVGIDAISLFEFGDYTLAGSGGAATSTSAGASMLATVTEIDGVSIAPQNLAPVNASFGDSLPGIALSAPWSLGITVDVAAQLIGLGYPAAAQATKVEVVIVNTLVSTSEPGTVAVINKTDFKIGLDTEAIRYAIPEPHTLALAAIAMCVAAALRRRGRAYSLPERA